MVTSSVLDLSGYDSHSFSVLYRVIPTLDRLGSVRVSLVYRGGGGDPTPGPCVPVPSGPGKDGLSGVYLACCRPRDTLDRSVSARFWNLFFCLCSDSEVEPLEGPLRPVRTNDLIKGDVVTLGT